jgi:hypothetical protein
VPSCPTASKMGTDGAAASTSARAVEAEDWGEGAQEGRAQESRPGGWWAAAGEWSATWSHRITVE